MNGGAPIMRPHSGKAQRSWIAIVAATSVSCLGDPISVGGVRLELTSPLSDSMLVGTVGHPLSDRIVVRALDHSGHTVPGLAVEWRVIGRGARTVEASATTDGGGSAGAI